MENITRYSFPSGIYNQYAIVKCRYCEREFYDYELEIGGYCDDCWNDELTQCYHCDDVVPIDTCGEVIIDRRGNTATYCDDCIGNHTCRCDQCGEQVDDNCVVRDDITTICEHCYNEHYSRCCSCDCLVHESDMCSHDDDVYCQYCYDNIEEDEEYNDIHDYSYKPTPVFYTIEPTERYNGLEIEFDSEGNVDRSDVIEYLKGFNEHYLKRDGSLTEEGIELVTHPMSLQYIREKYPLRDICEKIKECGYRSHDTNTCGLHVHISKKTFGYYNDESREKVISRFVAIIDCIWPYMVKFSRRTQISLNRWAKKYALLDNDNAEDVIKTVKDTNQGDRYVCVNLQNTHTVEVRMFRGSLNHNTIMGTLELLDILVDISLSDVSPKKVNWNTIKDYALKWGYKEFMAYCERKGL